MTTYQSSKTSFQVLSFLRNFTPKSDIDETFIRSYLETTFKIPSKTPVFAPRIVSNPLDVQSFTQWLKMPLAAFSVARNDKTLYILGNTTLKTASAIGKMDDNGPGSVEKCELDFNTTELSPATDEEYMRFYVAMQQSGLQPDHKNLKLEEKYIPKPLEKVRFYTPDKQTIGLGVVRQAYADTGEVELFCYYIYPDQEGNDKIGYNMHEKNICNLHDYVFENMLDDKNSKLNLNGVSCLRRMNRELEKRKKVWKDKLHRIEPLQPKSNKGERYWYINDKFKVVQEREKETATSHFRYLVGNYFTNELAAYRMLDKWLEGLHDYMASDKWPEYE